MRISRPPERTSAQDPNQNCGTLPCWQWFAAENIYSSNVEINGCVADSGGVILEADPNSNESSGYKPLEFPWPDNAGFPCYEHNTMTDLLEANGFNWRYYGNNSASSLWNAPNAIEHICQTSGVGGHCTGPDWPGQAGYNGKIVIDPTQALADLGANNVKCNLPPVSWVIPDGNWSDHPGTPGENAGPSWVAAIVNAVGGYDNSGHKLPLQCNYWDNTVVLVTWDDWGGWYDDVSPSSAAGGPGIGYANDTGQQYVYGFRVPLLVVSAWTPRGYVSGSPSQGGEVQPYIHDFGSILNFTEWALGKNQASIGEISPNYHYADFLAPDALFSCGTKCQKPWSLYDFFVDFSSQPRAFTNIIGAKYPTSYFLDPSAYFPSYPADPDNDAIESQ